MVSIKRLPKVGLTVSVAIKPKVMPFNAKTVENGSTTHALVNRQQYGIDGRKLSLLLPTVPDECCNEDV